MLPSFIGAGNSPCLTQVQIVLSDTPIMPLEAGRADIRLVLPLHLPSLWIWVLALRAGILARSLIRTKASGFGKFIFSPIK